MKGVNGRQDPSLSCRWAGGMHPLRSAAPRRTLRIPLPVEILLQEEKVGRFLGYVASVSECGAFIQCSRPRPVGTSLRVLLRLPGAPLSGVRCWGVIVWTRGYGGAEGPSQGMGLRFTGMEESSLNFLRRFCAESEPCCPGAQPEPLEFHSLEMG